jgi:hypothetical protein
MTTSGDRYVKPADGEDPRDIDRELMDAEVVARREATRQVSHQQEATGEQGLSTDAKGYDAADRDTVDADEAPIAGPEG